MVLDRAPFEAVRPIQGGYFDYQTQMSDVQSPPGNRISCARAGPHGSFPKSTNSRSLQLHAAALGVTVDPHHPRALLGHLRIKLVVPNAIQRTADIQPLSVETELQHLWAAGEVRV